MSAKIKIVCLGLLLTLCYFYGYAQDSLKNLNSYKYIYIIQRGKPKDSVKVKQGYWIEKESTTDSVVSWEEHRVVYRGITVFTVTAKGNYLDNMKVGIWQYYNWDNNLCKEVEYKVGIIRSVKYYYGGHLRILAVFKRDDDTGKFHFEKYDDKGKKVYEGDFPAELVYSGLIYSGLSLMTF